MCTHTAHAHMPVCGNANFARIHTCKLFYLCSSGLRIETACNPGRIRDLALVSSSVRSDLLHCTHLESNPATRECRRRLHKLQLDAQPIAHRLSYHTMHGTRHASRTHPFFLSATLKYLRISHFAKSSSRHVRYYCGAMARRSLEPRCRGGCL